MRADLETRFKPSRGYCKNFGSMGKMNVLCRFSAGMVSGRGSGPWGTPPPESWYVYAFG
jgi:hypothetical protein